MIQYADGLAVGDLDRLIETLRRRFPGIRQQRVAPPRLFRTVDILLPD
jgi:hypothetical protein